jgi:hypothetical protein
MPNAGDISSILEAADTYKKSVNQNNVNLQSTYGNAIAQTEGLASIYETIGTNNVIIDQAKTASSQKIQQARLDTASKLGTDMSLQGNVLSSLISDQQEALHERNTQLQEINRKRAVGFFDDPLQWAVNQFTINDDIAKHNAANEVYQARRQQILDLNQETQQTVVTQNMLDTSATQASAKASADNAFLSAKVLADKERKDGIVYGAEQIKAAMTADNYLYQTVRDTFAAKQQAISTNLALERMAMEREQLDSRKQKEELGSSLDAWLIERYNKGVEGRLGSKAVAVSLDSDVGKRIVQLYKIGGELGDQVKSDVLRGKRALEMDPTGAFRSLAASPSDMLDMRTNSVPLVLTPAQEPIDKILAQTQDELSSAINELDPKKRLDKKDVNAVRAFVDNTANAKLAAQAKKINWKDSDNLLNINVASTELLSQPQIASLPITQKFILPRIQAGASMANPDAVFAALANAVIKGDLSYNEARDYPKVIAQAQAVNLATRQLSSFGFRLTPEMMGYNVELTTKPTGLFGKHEIVDISKDSSFDAAFNKYVSDKLAEQFRPKGRGQSPVGPFIDKSDILR